MSCSSRATARSCTRRSNWPTTGASADAGFVAQRWARLRVDELLPQPELHRTEIAALGQRFGIVTPETSLIVLETLADYQRYDLLPPPGPLRDAWNAGLRARPPRRRRNRRSTWRRWSSAGARCRPWWDKDFPKDKPAVMMDSVSQAAGAGRRSARDAQDGRRRRIAPSLAMAAPPMPAPARDVSATMVMREQSADAARAEPKALKKAATATSAEIHIAVQAWTPDAAGMRRLAQAAADDRYAVYLDLRLAAPSSPAFYLDAAQVFATHGQRAFALRVLSNLAELHIEDRGLLRVLAYRLQEMGETAEAVRLLQRVTELAPDEPQSWRDLGLAHAAAGAWQPAIDALWTTASGTWDARFGDVDVIALGELDAIAATHRVDMSAVDTRLRRNLPLDVRVALAWDTDNTDVDLWVKDPNGEWVSYQNLLSRQGGRMTLDFTGGYGPEVFALKKAIPGVYEVHAKYYASHRQALGNATSVMMRLTTGFGTPAEKHRDTIVRLQEASDDLLIGTFEVR